MYFGSIHSGPHRLSEHAGRLQDRAAAVQPPDLCGNVPPDRPGCTEDLLDDVRGAACNMQLPAVNYKIDQWLNTCKQAWQADPAAFMAAVNADAKAAQACAGGQRGAARPAGRCAHAERGVAGAAAAAAGRSVAAGCRRRHRQGHLAGTAHCLCDGGQDLRLFRCRRSRPARLLLLAGEDDPAGAQGPSAGGRGRHEPGAGADRRRLLWQDRPAPYPSRIRHWRILPPRPGRCCSSWTRCRAFCPPMWRWQAATRCAVPCCRCAIAAKQGCAVLIVMHSQQKAGRFRPRTSGRQLGYLGHGPQRADDGPRQERRQNLSQPRKTATPAPSRR